VPRFFIARAIIVIFLTCSTLRTIMAQDRTFFSELNCEFGAQFPEFGEAGLDQDGDRFLGAFERSDNTLNVEEDALRSSPGRRLGRALDRTGLYLRLKFHYLQRAQ
jgi:hypothetical protein